VALSELPEGYASAKRLYASAQSEVYSALRAHDGREVVLKLYKGKPAERRIARARREHEALTAVSGRGIPQALELRLDTVTPALVTAQVPGVAMASWVTAALPCSAFLNVAIQLSEILALVHAAHFVHRDVNPWNVIIDPKTLETHLIDFGLARRLGSAELVGHSPSGGVDGTLHYIAPEQTGRMNRGCDARSDLYSLGATLYHALTGVPPFRSKDPLELIHAHIARLPAPPRQLRPDAPELLSDLVLKLLRKEPEERYASASALLADLRVCRDQLDRTGAIAAFELGRASAAQGLRFGTRLYGRERELALLQELLASAAAGSSRVLWIEGKSGTGKSVLVDTLRPHVAERGGYWVSGKFDAHRERAYAGWSAALGLLVQQVLLESDARLQVWRSELRDRLGSIAAALLPLAPDLEFILGETGAVPALGPRETQARLSLALRRLLSVCADREHPLVIFLDDLQWSDAGSRFLLEDLLQAGAPEGLLLIGAFQPSETDEARPIEAFQSRLASRGIASDSSALGPLSRDAVSALLGDLLGGAPEATRSLGGVIERKTGNTPLLVRQFLEHIHARGLLRHADGVGWSWDPDEIAAADVPDGAVALMTARVARLASEPRALLEFASCVGDEFDVELLAELSGRARETLEPVLDVLTEAGLIVPCPQGLRFVHGRVRETVQSLLDAAVRERLHHDMALLLLDRTPEAERGDQVFAIVEHLNLGLAYLSEGSRSSAVQLNLEAGKRSLAAGAAATSERYLAVARQLFREEDWQDARALGLQVFLRSAECALLRFDFDAVRAALDAVEPHCQALLEWCELEEKRIQLLALTTQPQEAIRYCLDVLRKVGLRIPLRPSRLRAQIALRFAQWTVRLRGSRAFFRAAARPDPRTVARIRIIGAAGGPMTRFDGYLLALVVSWMVRSNTRDGYVARPGYSLSSFATWLQVVLGDAQDAKRLARIALELTHQDEPVLRSRLEMQQGAMLHPFWMRRREALAELDRVADNLRELGDIEYVQYTRFMQAYFSGMAGEIVSETDRRLQEQAAAIARSGQRYPLPALCHPIYHLLTQRDLSSSALEQAVAESDARLVENRDSLQSYTRTMWVMVLCILGRHDLAFDQSEKLGELRFRVTPWVHIADHTFYRGLACAALASEHTGAGRRRYRRELRASLRRTRHWARSGPDFEHMAKLLAAESARLRGDSATARALYEQASQRARQQEFIHHAALAWERQAAMLEDQRRETEAAAARNEAAGLYARWGAHAKVSWLASERRY
jgi:tRNA A-37 threonylcarbamoyl transferase component Bud32